MLSCTTRCLISIALPLSQAAALLFHCAAGGRSRGRGREDGGREGNRDRTMRLIPTSLHTWLAGAGPAGSRRHLAPDSSAFPRWFFPRRQWLDARASCVSSHRRCMLTLFPSYPPLSSLRCTACRGCSRFGFSNTSSSRLLSRPAPPPAAPSPPLLLSPSLPPAVSSIAPANGLIGAHRERAVSVQALVHGQSRRRSPALQYHYTWRRGTHLHRLVPHQRKRLSAQERVRTLACKREAEAE